MVIADFLVNLSFLSAANSTSGGKDSLDFYSLSCNLQNKQTLET